MVSMNLYKVELVKDKSIRYEADNRYVSSAGDCYNLLLGLGMDRFAAESFYEVCLDAKGKVVGVHEVSRGGLTFTMVHPREVFNRAILNNAASIIVAHNHPSGDPTPSCEDRELTKRLIEAGKLLGIKVLDHIIVGDGAYESLMNYEKSK